MERKTGEIFEHNGEWYQCVESSDCPKCDLKGFNNCNIIYPCSVLSRKDGNEVIFKKLEKVEEPITVKGRTFQKLSSATSCKNCVFNIPNKACYKNDYIDGPCSDNEIWAEIKQNKEDMEEKKQKIDDLVGLYSSAKITYKEFDKELKALYDKEEREKTLKPFSLEATKAGKPVCTRDGRKARIICFDYNGETGDYPIVALVHYNKGNKCYERVLKYTSDGVFNKYGDCQHNYDLMMLPEKKEGWYNVYKSCIYSTKEEAERVGKTNCNFIKTIKVEWEE